MCVCHHLSIRKIILKGVLLWRNDSTFCHPLVFLWCWSLYHYELQISEKSIGLFVIFDLYKNNKNSTKPFFVHKIIKNIVKFDIHMYVMMQMTIESLIRALVSWLPTTLPKSWCHATLFHINVCKIESLENWDYNAIKM